MEDNNKEYTDLSYEDVVRQISDIYTSNYYSLLLERFNKVSFLEIIKRERRETVHSAFLAWFFNQKIIPHNHYNPVLMLLRLVALNSVGQQKLNLGEVEKDFLHSVITNNIKILSSNASVEVPTSSSKGSGRSDIVIVSEYEEKDKNKNKKLRIVLENKIDHIETKDQCGAYFEYFSKMSDVTLTLYIFLSVEEQAYVSCDKYICISYQNLLDNILEPTLNISSQIPRTVREYVQEYVNTITSIRTPSNKKQIAMSADVKKLLADFYRNNENIILAAINAEAPEEIKEKIKEAKNRSSYELTYTDVFGKQITEIVDFKSQLAKKFVEIYCSMHPTETLNDIQQMMKDVKKDLIFDQYKDRSKQIDGKEWWILTGIWGDGTNYFENLIKTINKNGISVKEIKD